jgi:uncharacterized protein DUF6931
LRLPHSEWRTSEIAALASPKLKIKAATAQEICTGFALSEDAKSCLEPEMPPLAFVEVLIQKSLHADAVQFLARALPKREAVWWACLCTRDLGVEAKPSPPKAALEAAEAWVYRPSEENRRKAEVASQALAQPHPARWTAMAAFWSEGSLAPVDAPHVKPPEDFTAKAVAGAIMMAAGLQPEKAQDRNNRFLSYGVDIAKGGTGRPTTIS